MKYRNFYQRLSFLTLLGGLSISVSFGQVSKASTKTPAKSATKSATQSPASTPVKTAPKKQVTAAAATTPAQKKPAPPAVVKPAAPPPAVELPATDWSAIAEALNQEEWTKAAQLSLLGLGKLKIDNDKKQLAQLRYFYIFALSGELAQNKLSSDELEKIVQSFLGKEFLMPSRQIAADCAGKVNYICPVKADEKALRVTATNKAASAILSLEYIHLPRELSFKEFNGNKAFSGGTLKEVQIFQDKSDNWVMRLVFEDGFVYLAKE